MLKYSMLQGLLRHFRDPIRVPVSRQVNCGFVVWILHKRGLYTKLIA